MTSFNLSIMRYVSFLVIFCEPLSDYNLIDLEFDAKQTVGLRRAVSELRESLNFKIYFYDAVEDTLLGTAVVDIWIMIEDGCNIVRQVSYYDSRSPFLIILCLSHG